MLLHVLQSVEKEKDRCSSVPCFFLLASCFIITIVKFKNKNYDLQGSQQYQYQGLPELFGNPARHGKRELRDVPQPFTGGQHAKFQGGL